MKLEPEHKQPFCNSSSSTAEAVINEPHDSSTFKNTEIHTIAAIYYFFFLLSSFLNTKEEEENMCMICTIISSIHIIYVRYTEMYNTHWKILRLRMYCACVLCVIQ